MKYIYTRKLVYLLLPTLCYVHLLFTAGPNPVVAPDLNDFIDEGSKLEKKERKYYQFIACTYPLHAMIIRAATDDEFKKLDAQLSNPETSLCEAETQQGNTPFHLLAHCDSNYCYLDPALKDTVPDQNRAKQIVDELIYSQTKDRYRRKSEMVTKLCEALEQRALAKAIVIDDALAHPMTNRDGSQLFPASYEWKEFANGIRMVRPNITPNPLLPNFLDFPDDIYDLFANHFNFSELMAFRTVCKTLYFSTLHRAACTTQKKYVLDILNIRNKDGETALETVVKFRIADARATHKKKIAVLQYQFSMVPRAPMQFSYQQYQSIEAERFPIALCVAAQLEQLEARYARMPGNITCNPKPAPIPVPQKAANTLRGLLAGVSFKFKARELAKKNQ